MTMRATDIPSEKTTETLFVSNAFHYLKTHYPHLQISIFAPSQTDEDELGYDAQFLEQEFGFELVLQFKKMELKYNTPTLSPSHQASKSGKHTKTQHEVLRDKYPFARTAFYIAPTFRDYNTVNKKQSLNSEEFLDNYLAVDVSKLSKDTTRIRYIDDKVGHPADVWHLERNKQTRLALNYKDDWLKGSELFKNFLPCVAKSKSATKTGSWDFSGINSNQAVGSLVHFGKGATSTRMYSVPQVTQLDFNNLLDQNNVYQGGYPLHPNFRQGVGLSTFGLYIFRVYFSRQEILP